MKQEEDAVTGGTRRQRGGKKWSRLCHVGRKALTLAFCQPEGRREGVLEAAAAGGGVYTAEEMKARGLSTVLGSCCPAHCSRKKRSGLSERERS